MCGRRRCDWIGRRTPAGLPRVLREPTGLGGFCCSRPARQRRPGRQRSGRPLGFTERGWSGQSRRRGLGRVAEGCMRRRVWRTPERPDMRLGENASRARPPTGPRCSRPVRISASRSEGSPKFSDVRNSQRPRSPWHNVWLQPKPSAALARAARWAMSRWAGSHVRRWRSSMATPTPALPWHQLVKKSSSAPMRTSSQLPCSGW